MYVYRPTHLPALSDYATGLLYAYIRYHGTLVQNSRKRLHVTYAEQVFFRLFNSTREFLNLCFAPLCVFPRSERITCQVGFDV